MRRLSDCNRVHLVHLRKAGGTTMRRTLERICDLHGLRFSASEGWPMLSRDFDSKTFVVANFRDPLERIYSLYNNEGPWRGRVGGHKAVPFSVWLADLAIPGNSKLPPLWHCVSNYYVRSFSDFAAPDRRSRRNVRDRVLTSKDYQKAVTGVMRVDLVVICEWLDQDLHRQYLSSHLLSPGDGLMSFPRKNMTALKHKFDIRNDVGSKQNTDLLTDNLMDLELYRLAKWRARCDAIRANEMAESGLEVDTVLTWAVT